MIYSLFSIFLLATVNCKKLFIDNDGLTAAQLLFPISAGYDIVGISMSFGSSSTVDSTGQAYSILEEFNLSSCIPLYVGAQQPLLRTNESFHIWELMFGQLVWEGAFSAEYEDSYTWDEIKYNDTLPGAVALINAVRENKDTDPVVIFAAGMMTTIAQAISIYPNLTKESGGLFIMGGYFDNQYAQVTESAIVNDINTDINLMQDPEAAQIVLTGDWPKLVIGGNVTNYLVPSQRLYDEIIERAGGIEEIDSNNYFQSLQNIVYSGNFTENNEQQTLPFWDEVVSFYLSYPEVVESEINVRSAVDTSYYSPFYGSLRIWGEEFAPKSSKTGNATIITKIDDDKFYDKLLEVLFTDWRQYCSSGQSYPYDK